MSRESSFDILIFPVITVEIATTNLSCFPDQPKILVKGFNFLFKDRVAKYQRYDGILDIINWLVKNSFNEYL